MVPWLVDFDITKLARIFRTAGAVIRQCEGLFTTRNGVIFMNLKARTMKNIAILVPETAVVEAVADPRYLFTAVNEFLKSGDREPLFNVQLVGLTPEVKVTDGIFSIHVDAVLGTARKPDLIIVPAVSGNMETAVRLNKDFLPWIVKHYKEGTEVASLCLGAFILAGSTANVSGRHGFGSIAAGCAPAVSCGPRL